MNRPGNLSRAEQACNELTANGQPVTFTAVAEQAGIGRATLYRDPAIRAVIDDHRRQAASANTLSGLAADIAALHTAIEAVAARVRNHEEQLRQLKRATAPAKPRR
jgi:hypothetical protein